MFMRRYLFAGKSMNSVHIFALLLMISNIYLVVFQTVDCNPFVGCDTDFEGCKTREEKTHVCKKGN